MNSSQSFIEVGINEIISKVDEMKKGGYTLSQISVTKKDDFDLLYTFEKDYNMINLRVNVNVDETIESISNIYGYAFLYENEMKDLFGVKIKNMNIDFKGNLYKTSIKTPFNPEEKGAVEK